MTTQISDNGSRLLALLIVTDGRMEYMAQAHESLRARLKPWPQQCFITNDSADPAYEMWLRKGFRDFTTFSSFTRKGMAKNMECGWRMVMDCCDAKYVFHTEEDFVFHSEIDLEAMAKKLDQYPHLAQLVLKRDPVSPEEIQAGGQIETNPSVHRDGDGFVEHKQLFSCNPSLVRVDALRLAIEHGGTKHEGGIERGMTDVLLPAGYSFAYWGKQDDPPLAKHIGTYRSAGYRW